jgi:hypothetical protein
MNAAQQAAMQQAGVVGSGLSQNPIGMTPQTQFNPYYNRFTGEVSTSPVDSLTPIQNYLRSLWGYASDVRGANPYGLVPAGAQSGNMQPAIPGIGDVGYQPRYGESSGTVYPGSYGSMLYGLETQPQLNLTGTKTVGGGGGGTFTGQAQQWFGAPAPKFNQFLWDPKTPVDASGNIPPQALMAMMGQSGGSGMSYRGQTNPAFNQQMIDLYKAAVGPTGPAGTSASLGEEGGWVWDGGGYGGGGYGGYGGYGYGGGGGGGGGGNNGKTLTNWRF